MTRMTRKRASRKTRLSLLVVAVALFLAAAIPPAAHAYWACVGFETGTCSTETWCTEYNEATDLPTGRLKVVLEQNVNC